MKTRRFSTHKVLKTLSRLSYYAGTALLIASLVFNALPMQNAQAQQGGSGAIWTTIQPCSVAADADQDKNIYAIGENVTVRGKGFLPLTGYTVTVAGNPGGSSGDPGVVVANKPAPTDDTGYFCVDAYTIQDDDWGEYTVDAWLEGSKVKNDNYRVEAGTSYLGVEKTVNTTYDLSYTWTIDKSVDVASHTLLLGESATSNYTVTLNRTLSENWTVSGTITISNPSKYVVELTSVSDTFNGMGASVSCPSMTVGKRSSLTCTYSINGTGTPPTGHSNTATVTTYEESPVQGGSSPAVPVVFPAPTVSGYEAVSVTDTWAGPLTFVDGVANYSREFTCEEPGPWNYPNTATIIETEQSDSAAVNVICEAHPPLDVSKTAEASFDREYTWSITKSVTPSVHNLMDGGTGTSDYTITIDQTVTDKNMKVEGDITIHNPATIPATITSVVDSMAAADCGVSFPYQLAAGGDLVCSYAASPATTASGTNNVTVTTSGLVGGGSASAPYTFGAPANIIGYPTVNVTDTMQPGQSRSFSDDGSWTYSKDFTCDLEGSRENSSTTYNNTATITETGQSDDASVEVNCSAYAPLTISKTALTSYTRTHSWTIDKSVDISEHVLLIGGSGTSTYTVDLVKTTVDSDFMVSGEITITNNEVIPALISSVTDSLPGATVDCGVTFPYILPASGVLVCDYSAPLESADATTNTATVISTGLVLGGTSAPVDVIFGEPSEVVGEDVVTVSDPMADGEFGPFEDSTSFNYPHTFFCEDPINETYPNTATINETGQFDTALVSLICSEVPTPTPTPETPTPVPTSTPTVPPTLPPPNPTDPPQVLIPVTGADLSMPSPLGHLQSVFGNIGLALLGFGMVLQGLSRRFEDEE